MKNSRTIILITGILAAGLAYNTAFAQERATTQKEESKAFAKVKYAKAFQNHTVKNKPKPQPKVHASAVKYERMHHAKDMKAHHKARTKADVRMRIDPSTRSAPMKTCSSVERIEN